MCRRPVFVTGFLACIIVVARPGLSEVYQDLAATAQQAEWSNDRGERLPFPGSDTDARGFARVLTTKLVGIPRTHENVLETHPRWQANGTIEGRYRMTIPENAVFESTVGFRQGAVGTDGVRFEVIWRSPQRMQVLGHMDVTYGRPGHMNIDLGRLAGQQGELILRVKAGASAARDWAVWLAPQVKSRVERPAGPGRPTSDLDRDGIPDDTERELLAKYRPHFRFTQGEQYRPCDALWFIRHCSLKAVADEESASVITAEVLRADPARLLSASRSGGDWGSSDLTRNPRKTRYCLNPGNRYRDGYEPGDGHDWAAIRQIGNVGLYGQVVPWRNQYKVSYWQFYGYNDTELPDDVLDHEAEWESIHLLVDPDTGWLTKSFHCLHAKEIVFDFTVQGVSRVMLDDNTMEFRGPNYDTSNFNVRTNIERACNNLVRFFKDPGSGEFTHPVIYVERGSHGSWPSEHWKWEQREIGRDWSPPPHTGNGHIFLSNTPPNLGEVEHPLSNDARIILRYNGRWGAYRGQLTDLSGSDTPPGPALHWQWVWPAGSELRARIPDDAFSDDSSFFHRER